MPIHGIQLDFWGVHGKAKTAMMNGVHHVLAQAEPRPPKGGLTKRQFLRRQGHLDLKMNSAQDAPGRAQARPGAMPKHGAS